MNAGDPASRMIPDHASIPPELVAANRWVLWKATPRQSGKFDKVPRRASNPEVNASSTDPSSWASFDEAVAALPFSGCDGIGFVLGDGFTGLDLDECLDGESLRAHAEDVLARLPPTYTEVSPSGAGLHALLRGELPGKGRRRAGIELYSAGRFLTVTGGRFRDAPLTLADGAAELAALWQELGGVNGDVPDREDWPEIILRRGAEPDPARLEALLANLPQARATWEERRPDLADQSSSGYDLALSSFAAAAGWSAQEIADLLIARRRRHGHDLHLKNRQKYQRTIAKALASRPEPGRAAEPAIDSVALESFYAYLPMHRFLYRPTGELWPASSVNSQLPPVEIRNTDGTPKLNTKGEPVRIAPSAWIDQHRPVQQMTWVPGEPEIVEDRLIVEGGWVDHPGARVFNLYRPPRIQPGDPAKATPWVKLLRRAYPDHHRHITAWMAHRVQRPQEKLNHALVLGGAQGIGKDTILEAMRRGVGPWNVSEVSPPVLMGRFNGFVKSVVLRVSEARDLGETNRFALYEHLKTYTAAPPDVLRVDEKNIREYVVPNVTGVVVTTNNRDGLYLPPDDRRHYVAWSQLTIADFKPDFWKQFWSWYQTGVWHVVAYLAERDLAGFDPKAPPPKTPAFWQFVDANRSPEDTDLADALDHLGNPDAVTLGQIGEAATSEAFRTWLGESKNAWAARKRMEEAGYVSVRNPSPKDGHWKIGGRRQVVYARQELTPREQIAAAQRLADRLRGR